MFQRVTNILDPLRSNPVEQKQRELELLRLDIEAAPLKAERRVAEIEAKDTVATADGKIREKNAAHSRDRFIVAAPLVGVNAIAITGQAFAYHSFGMGWQWAIGVGLVVESIALFLAYMAHKATMARDSSLALRLSSYGAGAGVGWLNAYDWLNAVHPHIAFAAIFGGASLVSPFLWGIHSRRTNRDAMADMGLIDRRGPKFAMAKWLNFPWRMWLVQRYATWHGIQDPAEALQRSGVRGPGESPNDTWWRRGARRVLRWLGYDAPVVAVRATAEKLALADDDEQRPALSAPQMDRVGELPAPTPDPFVPSDRESRMQGIIAAAKAKRAEPAPQLMPVEPPSPEETTQPLPRFAAVVEAELLELPEKYWPGGHYPKAKPAMIGYLNDLSEQRSAKAVYDDVSGALLDKLFMPAWGTSMEYGRGVRREWWQARPESKKATQLVN